MKAKKKGRRILWMISTATVITAVALGGWWLTQQNVKAAATAESGQVVTAFIGALSAGASASGQLLPQREASLALGIAGQAEQVFVEVGDEVKAGDVLVQLENDALQRAVRTAEQSLAIQEANLAKLRKPASAEDLAAAQAAVASAKARLDDLLAGPREKELADAQAALVSAQAYLDDLLAGPSEEELTSARAALTSARSAAKAAAERYAAIDDQITVARQQLAHAEIVLKNAQYFYDALANDWQHKDYAPFAPEAESLKNAQTAYNIALARYNLAIADINDSTYRSAQAQVAQAETNLAALTEEKRVEIAAAREQLAAAKANLAALTEEKTAQIASARDQLAQAKANLANLLEGASEEQLAIAKAQVEQARLSLANAQDRLSKATLIAPFDGAITAVHIAVGEWASGLAVELVDTSSLQVVLDVDEIDIGAIAVGQPTIITLETWPDRELKGEVVTIAPKAKTQAGIVTYQVHIRFVVGDSSPLPIRTGMTANANLITSNQENVLLVPNRAIIADRAAGKYYVNLVQGDSTVQAEVTIGLRDNNHTEITSGLGAGDKLHIIEVEKELKMGPGQDDPMGN